MHWIGQSGIPSSGGFLFNPITSLGAREKAGKCIGRLGKTLTYLLTYLLNYSLHGAISFLSS